MGRTLGTISGTFLAWNNLAKIGNFEKPFYGPRDDPMDIYHSNFSIRDPVEENTPNRE